MTESATNLDLDILCAPIDVNSRERDFIEKHILGPYWPWFWQEKQTYGDEDDIPDQMKPYVKSHNGQFLSHTLLFRTEDESVKYNQRPSNEISPHFEFFLELFNR